MKFPLTTDQINWIMVAVEAMLTFFQHTRLATPPTLPANTPEPLKVAVQAAFDYAKRKESDRHDDIEFDGILMKLSGGERKIIEEFVQFLADPSRKLHDRFRFNVVLQKGIFDEALVIKRLKDLAQKPSHEKRMESAVSGGLLQGDSAALGQIPPIFKAAWVAMLANYPNWQTQMEKDIAASTLPAAIDEANAKVMGWNNWLIGQIKKNIS